MKDLRNSLHDGWMQNVNEISQIIETDNKVCLRYNSIKNPLITIAKTKPYTAAKATVKITEESLHK